METIDEQALVTTFLRATLSVISDPTSLGLMRLSKTI